MSEFDKGIRALEKSLAQSGERFKSIGPRLTAGITLPLPSGDAAAQLAAEFESTMVDVIRQDAEAAHFVDKRRDSVRRAARRTDHRFKV